MTVQLSGLHCTDWTTPDRSQQNGMDRNPMQRSPDWTQVGNNKGGESQELPWWPGRRNDNVARVCVCVCVCKSCDAVENFILHMCVIFWDRHFCTQYSTYTKLGWMISSEPILGQCYWGICASSQMHGGFHAPCWHYSQPQLRICYFGVPVHINILSICFIFLWIKYLHLQWS